MSQAGHVGKKGVLRALGNQTLTKSLLMDATGLNKTRVRAILESLLDERMVTVEKRPAKGREPSQKVYQITDKGRRHIHLETDPVS